MNDQLFLVFLFGREGEAKGVFLFPFFFFLFLESSSLSSSAASSFSFTSILSFSGAETKIPLSVITNLCNSFFFLRPIRRGEDYIKRIRGYHQHHHHQNTTPMQEDNQPGRIGREEVVVRENPALELRRMLDGGKRSGTMEREGGGGGGYRSASEGGRPQSGERREGFWSFGGGLQLPPWPDGIC